MFYTYYLYLACIILSLAQRNSSALNAKTRLNYPSSLVFATLYLPPPLRTRKSTTIHLYPPLGINQSGKKSSPLEEYHFSPRKQHEISSSHTHTHTHIVELSFPFHGALSSRVAHVCCSAPIIKLSRVRYFPRRVNGPDNCVCVCACVCASIAWARNSANGLCTGDTQALVFSMLLFSKGIFACGLFFFYQAELFFEGFSRECVRSLRSLRTSRRFVRMLSSTGWNSSKSIARDAVTLSSSRSWTKKNRSSNYTLL